MVQILSFVQGIVKWLWENEASQVRRGWNFSMVSSYHVFRGKVVSVDLLTGRNDVYQYSSNIGVAYLLLPAWVEFSSGIGIVRSGKVVSNSYWQTRKPNSFWRGHLVFLAGVG